MKARVTWRDGESASDRPLRAHRGRSPRRSLAVMEWTFLLIGLLAVDIFVWVNTSSVLYQAYEDWAFDQTLRGLSPNVGEFVKEEAEGFFGREHVASPEKAEAPQQAPNAPPLMPMPQPEAVIGRLEIPRLKISVMVRQGADEGTLSRAVGHIPETALPGYMGNVGLAGHRDTFFRPLRFIHPDDVIEMQTTGGTYRYLVTSTQIVSPRDVSVLKASGGRTLTLVTCYPFYYVGSAPRRFIVHAIQVGPNPQRQPQPSS